MVRRLIVRLPIVILFVGLLGQVNCAGQSEEKGPRCKELCEKGLRECPMAPHVDCESNCLYEDARAQRTGCQDEVDAVANCSDHLDDICTAPTACKPELDRFWACVNAYCAKHPSSMYCPKPEDG